MKPKPLTKKDIIEDCPCCAEMFKYIIIEDVLSAKRLLKELNKKDEKVAKSIVNDLAKGLERNRLIDFLTATFNGVDNNIDEAFDIEEEGEE